MILILMFVMLMFLMFAMLLGGKEEGKLDINIYALYYFYN
jgi:hypothetical protein